MKHSARRTGLALFAGLCAVAFAIAAAAQVGGSFEISSGTIDNGGGIATGDGLSVDGTIGQPDAGLAAGGSFVLQGGFWTRDTADLIFRDSFEQTNTAKENRQ